MIKCFGFGKLLKPLFIISLISFFGFCLNFSDASAISRVRNNGVYGFSPLNNSLDVAVFNKGQLGSQKFGNTQRMIALDSRSQVSNTGLNIANDRWIFFRSLGQKPYFIYADSEIDGRHPNGYKMQGFFNTYYLCDELYGSENFTNLVSSLNCQSYALTDNFKTEIGGLFSGMTTDDYWAFSYTTGNCENGHYSYSQICFSCSAYSKSICFAGGLSYYTDRCQYYSNALTGSLNIGYDIDFTQINPAYIYESPAFEVGYVGIPDLTGGTPTTPGHSVNSDFTGGYNYSTCTYSQVLSQLENFGYNINLCRGGLDNFQTASQLGLTGIISTPGTGKRLDEIFNYTSDGSNLNDWFSYRNTIYNNPFTYNQNVWEVYPAVLRSYFSYYNQFNGNRFKNTDLAEYCLIKKAVLSGNGDTIYNDSTFKSACNNYVFYNSNNGLSGGIVLDSVNLDGVGLLSGVKKTSAVEFIQTFFNRIQLLVPSDISGLGSGILPLYILTFLFALILFRFIRH